MWACPFSIDPYNYFIASIHNVFEAGECGRWCVFMPLEKMLKPSDRLRVKFVEVWETNPLDYRVFDIHVLYDPIFKNLHLEFDPCWCLYVEMMLTELKKQMCAPENFQIKVLGSKLTNASKLSNFVSQYVLTSKLTIELSFITDTAAHKLLLDSEFKFYEVLTPEDRDRFLKRFQSRHLVKLFKTDISWTEITEPEISDKFTCYMRLY